MERGKKRIRTGQEVSPLRAVTPPPFKLSQVQPRTSEDKVVVFFNCVSTQQKISISPFEYVHRSEVPQVRRK
jgi:hypothetical protein